MGLSKSQRRDIAIAIQQVIATVRWKSGKDIEHLATRKRYGHLPDSTTIDQYNSLITEIARENDNVVYAYVFGKQLYVGITGDFRGDTWLILFGLDGTIETAFPPTEPEEYLFKRGFERVGLVRELLT